MAVASEDYDSREINLGKNPYAHFKYTVLAAVDELDARAAVLMTAPPAYQGLFRLTCNVKPVGNGVYKADVNYGLGERSGSSPSDGSQNQNQTQPSDPIGPEMEFDIAGVSHKMTKSLEVRAAIKLKVDTRAIPDTRGAIGQSDKGVEGCDRDDVNMEWSETWSFPPGSVTWMYVKLLRSMYGRVNDAPWRTFGDREVRYRGGIIRASGTEKTKITYKFATAQDPTSEFKDAFSDTIWQTPAVYPSPWDYVDVLYEADVSATKKIMIPAFVYIHRLFDSASFLDLGIGR